MLEGRNVDLKLIEKEEIPQLLEMMNRPEFHGNYESPWQTTKADMERNYDQQKGVKRFFIQKKDGTRAGTMSSWEVVPESPGRIGAFRRSVLQYYGTPSAARSRRRVRSGGYRSGLSSGNLQ